jgi:enamine deaminase RidA (YjgF/YER057c/UK114 family)
MKITRYEADNELALSGMVEAGGFIFVSFCVGNIGQSIEAQINGAFDHLEKRLSSVGLSLESIVKIDALFRDVWNIPVMEEIIRERFNGNFPARKSIQTEFAHIGGQHGLLFQLDAVAYRGEK